MNYVVGDIGNTLTKISILNQRFLIKKSFYFQTQKLNKKKYLNNLSKKIGKNSLNSKVLFSSVVPNIYKKIRSELIKKKFKVFEMKDLKLKKIIKIKINNFRQLGSDRIANAIACYKNKNTLIIDFGTATTFDIIKNNIYVGGVIAPGINLSIINLNKHTASLPLINLKNKQKSYGKNTKDALNAGILWGYEGLINNIIRRIIKKTKKKYKIILTGGYSKLLKNFIRNKSFIDTNITIKGIAITYKKLL